MDLRAQRAAENEGLFRRVNERVAELSGDFDEFTLVCECADAACAERLAGIPSDEYEEVRAHAERFFVVRGHERSAVESVVVERDGYLVVEKRGEAGEVARESDPRGR